jgi:hypothetical protein
VFEGAGRPRCVLPLLCPAFTILTRCRLSTQRRFSLLSFRFSVVILLPSPSSLLQIHAGVSSSFTLLHVRESVASVVARTSSPLPLIPSSHSHRFLPLLIYCFSLLQLLPHHQQDHLPLTVCQTAPSSVPCIRNSSTFADSVRLRKADYGSGDTFVRRSRATSYPVRRVQGREGAIRGRQRRVKVERLTTDRRKGRRRFVVLPETAKGQ